MTFRPALTFASVAAVLLLAARPGDAAYSRFVPGTGAAVGTVYDTVSGLTWQQTASGATYSQTAAAAYCQSLSLNGTAGRLPTLMELASILDLTIVGSPHIDGTNFIGTQNTRYWSSTLSAAFPGLAWVLHFGDGNQTYTNMSNANAVRCVL